MTRTTILFLHFLLMTSVFIFATGKDYSSISGKLKDGTGDPIAYATIMLLNKDSVLVKADYSRDDGSFTFEGLDAGAYKVSLRSIQYQPYISEIIELTEGQSLMLPPIQLNDAVQQLDEVTVTATKPLIEVHPDKTVFNVSSSANSAGTDGLEMLRKAPGVVIDNNDNIMLQGKSGVKIYIDGKPSRLSGEDLVNMLRSMQSDGVESVEIVTNPSAKYEAEGNAGIIDIKLKRDKNLGLNGAVNLGYNIGGYNSYRGGVDFNYRDRKLNIFGNYNYHDNKGYSGEDHKKEINDIFLDQKSKVNWNHAGHGFRLGADYAFNKRHLVGVLFNGSVNDMLADIQSSTPFGSLETGIVEQRLDAESARTVGTDNANANLNYVYTGEKGAKLTMDADYGLFYKDGGSDQLNAYLDEEGQQVIAERLSADLQITQIDILAFKADYEKTLGPGRLSFGAKFSDVSADNRFKYYNILSDARIIDTNRSNDFFYSEALAAAYVSYNGKVNEKLTYNAGVRMERTHSAGHLESVQENEDNNVKRAYTDFFPSGGVAYQLNKNNKVALNYSRRIDRPNYESLNPFEFQLDELTYRKGNPYLDPQYTNNFQLTHNFKHNLNTQISYSITDDYFAQILDTTGNKGTMISVQNMASAQNLGLNVSYSMDITKRWSFYANTNLYKVMYKSDLQDKQFDLDATTLNIYAKTNLALPADISLEVSGWYNSPSVWGGTFRMKEMYSIDAGVKKSIWGKRAALKVSYSDIFNSSNWRGASSYGGLRMTSRGYHDSQVLRLSLTYNFGNQQVNSSRKRSTGLEEESNRLSAE